MITIDNRCTGCGLCSLVCPMGSISMSHNSEGFSIPIINKNTCVNCGICEKKCPNNNIELSYKSSYYACYCSNKNDLMSSSSGGLFITFAKYILDKGGYVSGCIFDDDFEAAHICTNDFNYVKKMCGSKYVQSNMIKHNVFEKILHLTKKEIPVLFTGTACQINAIKQYVNNKQFLLTIDVLCHGVPSPLYFNYYCSFLKKKYKSNLTSIEFRNKEKRGWGSEHRTCLIFEKQGKTFKKRPFMPAYFCSFFWGINLRESCYLCHYATKKRISDITIGDYWGYWNKYKKEFKDGISVCSINSEKGQQLFNAVTKQLGFFEPLDEHEAMGSNTNFYHPVIRPRQRDNFYIDIQKQSYRKMRKRVFNCHNFKLITKSCYGAVVPKWIRLFFRKIKQ